MLLGSEWLHLLTWMLRNSGIVYRGDEFALPSLQRGVVYLTKLEFECKNRSWIRDSWTIGVGVGAFVERRCSVSASSQIFYPSTTTVG